MKTLFIVLFMFCSFNAVAETTSYDSYNEIVDKLSAQRSQSLRSQMSITVPTEERLQVSLGLTNSSTSLQHNNLGTISQNGFLFGSAIPLIGNELYTEGFVKFFNSSHEGDTTTSLRQLELRLSHKEPMSFALWNMGLGVSARFMEVDSPSGIKTFVHPMS